MNPRYQTVAERARHCCEYCRAPEATFNFPFEVEQVVPTSRGGADQPANWALSCRACNLYKGVHLQATDPQSRFADEPARAVGRPAPLDATEDLPDFLNVAHCDGC